MTMTNFRATRLTALAAVLTVFAVPANAALIQGTLAFSGDIELSDGATLGTTDGLSFIDNDFDVDGTAGDLTDISQGAFGDIANFDFALGGSLPLLAIDDVTFELSAVDVVAQGTGFLLLQGTGVLSRDGFDDTNAIFTLSANSVGHLNVYSASLTAVPLPGAVWFLGSALVALGLRKRK